MSDFENAFGVPAGHRLRQVHSASRGRTSGEARWWEHEEYDQGGRLVAVYENWSQTGDGALAFVKYSPYGWVLSVSGRSARHSTPPPRRPRVEAA